MKGLIQNYIEQLSKNQLNEFAIKNDIHLNDQELDYLLNLIKNNWQDILKDETKYLETLKSKINEQEFIKINNLFTYYKKRYKGYLF